jgi:hypothetical protein
MGADILIRRPTGNRMDLGSVGGAWRGVPVSIVRSRSFEFLLSKRVTVRDVTLTYLPTRLRTGTHINK